MKLKHPVLLLALLALPVVSAGDRTQSAPIATPSAHYNTDVPRFAAGQILILDPKGKFDYAAQASDIQAALGNAVSQSSEGLVQEKLTTRGGGYKVNLQGRFQNAMTMSIDANGNITSSCEPAAAVPTQSTGKVK